MRRYELFDCLRGVAALAVVLYHLSVTRLAYPLIPQGYLAVDFFFALSGFIIANAYQSALFLGRRTISSFVWKRIVRLYPLAFAGAVFGLAVLFVKWIVFPGKVDPISKIWVSGALNILLLPSFWSGAASRHLLFPGNGALWSLFFELLINVLWAFLLVRRSIKELCIVLLASALLLIRQTHLAGTENLGNESATFLGGLARVSFGFTAGVLIYRLRGRLQAPKFGGGNWLLVACLSVSLAFPAAKFFSQEEYDLICAIVVMPMIVFAGMNQDGLGRFGQLSGELSYPLYALHYPILLIASGLHQAVPSWTQLHELCVLALATAVIASWLALTVYDKPSREFLFQLSDQASGNSSLPRWPWWCLPAKIVRSIGR